MSNIKGDQQDTAKSEAHAYPLEAIMAMQKALEGGIVDEGAEETDVPAPAPTHLQELRSDLALGLLTSLRRSFASVFLRVKNIRMLIFPDKKRSRRISAR